MIQPAFDFAVCDDHGKWRINGRAVEKDVEKHLSCTVDAQLSKCAYCGSDLVTREFEDVRYAEEKWHYNRSYVYARCDNCAHWALNGAEGGSKCMDSSRSLLVSAVLGRFVHQLPDACSQELAQHLRRHPSYWHEIDPKRLERLVADIFKANHCGAEVFHVGQPYDRGVDVVFIDSEGKRYLVQVKRRGVPSRSEGFSTLQSILGAMALDGARHGIVVSTADVFSFHARKGLQDAEGRGFLVEFIDKGKLNRMIGPLLPLPPWEKIFTRPELAWVDEEVQRHFRGPECDGQLPLFRT